MSRQTLIVIISILGSAIFLVLVLKDVPLAEVGAAMREADLLWVLLGFALVILSMWTRAIRWRGLLNNRISLLEAFYLMGITFTLNQLPLRAGEVARGLIVMRRNVPFMTAATSIIVERILDVLMVGVLLTASVPFLPNVPPQVTQGAVLFGTIGIVGFGVLLFFAHRPQVAHRLLDFIFKLLPFLKNFKRLSLSAWLDHIIEGLQPLTNWRTFAHAIIWTLIAWAVSLGTLMCLLRALHIETNYLLMTAIAISLASLSIALPINVAGIGVFEATIVFSGSLVGIDTVPATALGFLFHGNAVLGYIIVGVIGMFALGLSLSDIFKRDTANQA
jgi:uncharacterized protein (TIRG00374 family)